LPDSDVTSNSHSPNDVTSRKKHRRHRTPPLFQFIQKFTEMTLNKKKQIVHTHKVHVWQPLPLLQLVLLSI